MVKKTVDRKPSFQGWLTSDEDELARRRWRGRTEIVSVERSGREEGYFGDYKAQSVRGGSYRVEIRSLSANENSCGCHDFSTNGLGTCKHIEGVLEHLRKKGKKAFNAALKVGSSTAEICLPGRNPEMASIFWPNEDSAPDLHDEIKSLTASINAGDVSALEALKTIAGQKPETIRVSRFLDGWMEEKRRALAKTENKKRYLADVEAGREGLDIVKLPLLRYQVEGMLFLAFGERVLLADDMGLGKTVQAVAACELLRRRRGIKRVLVISPASLKSEWLEQIGKFSDLDARIIAGPRAKRLEQYRNPAFFTLANYEQILPDGSDINAILAPDLVILDEAQRIKNWQTKTAQAVKGLKSRYAFVLTGTPLENRIDEIYSIVQFLDPKILGPLFRFNRDYYVLDERGRPQDYKNLDDLGRRLKPVMMRRRKEDVEGELPGRTITNYFTTMTDEQRLRYEDYQAPVQRLLHLARKRPLLKQEFERLQMLLGCMRMTCDTPYILDSDNRDCPKLEELERILGDLLDGDDERKIIIFSEWVRMLELVREMAGDMGLEFAWHTGSVSQLQRRAEINRFKSDQSCRLFLSSDSGSVGLNLQVADIVINMDLPWNPAKLEQRIARAWRKHQKRSVHVINLIAEDSIEHRMVYLLDQKQNLADGVLDGKGDVKNLRMPSGRSAFFERMEQMMRETASAADDELPPDPLVQMRDELVDKHGDNLLSLTVRGEGEDKVLFAVLEGKPKELEAERQRLKKMHRIGVEVLSPETFETLRRLEASGTLRFSGADEQVLHRLPGFDGGGRGMLLAKARKLAGEADRNLRMAALLSGGGFKAESIGPARASIVLTMRSLVLAADADDQGDDALIDDILDTLEQKTPLPVQIRRQINIAISGEDDPAQLLASAGTLLDYARTVLESNKAAPLQGNSPA